MQFIIQNRRVFEASVLIEPDMTIEGALLRAAMIVYRKQGEPNSRVFQEGYDRFRQCLVIKETAGFSTDSRHVWNITVENSKRQVCSNRHERERSPALLALCEVNAHIGPVMWRSDIILSQYDLTNDWVAGVFDTRYRLLNTGVVEHI